VLRLLRGEALDALSRQTAVPVPRLEDWRQQALVGVDQALQIRVHDDPTELRLDEANRRIGELRYVGGHRVGRNRILRLMRHHQLLSPHFRVQRIAQLVESYFSKCSARKHGMLGC
jgi:hypothetical protein